ncbi:MAG: HU family DNA-binding protein [Clostridiales bacterium]|jgi:DNA-binding protein HU-beta|nr:HU family DNA-binding protein [Clostridiales bacterium]
MNKSELILSIEEKSGLSKQDSKKALEAVLETITEELVSGNKVSIVGFGSFDVKLRNERIGRNPKTKEEITIPASRVPQFKAGKALKDAVAK